MIDKEIELVAEAKEIIRGLLDSLPNPESHSPNCAHQNFYWHYRNHPPAHPIWLAQPPCCCRSLAAARAVEFLSKH